VGKRDGYKDAATLVAAFARIAGMFPDLHLVLVGGGELSEDEQRVLAVRGLADRVRHEHLPDSAMPAAYAHARAFVFPSRYEGFGLPALESMASGTPTILCESASLPEVGGEAALYFPPGDAQALAAAIEAVLEGDPQVQRLTELGRARAREFTWEQTARRTSEVYAH